MSTPKPFGHAEALAETARRIHTPQSLDATLSSVAQAARVSIPGFDHAGITTVDGRGRIRTRAASDDLVRRLDDLQYELMQGPCVDALHETPVVAVPHIADDPRWPEYIARAVPATGLKSQLGIRLFLDDEGTLGGLNLYSTTTEEIDPDAVSVAELFAVHAAVALGNAKQVTELNTALQTRKVIGQALGILMERYRMDEDRAFALLVRTSSHENVKLHTLAQHLVDEANATP